MEHQPLIKKRHGISPIWTFPLLAALLGGWLLYQGYLEAGIEIEVYFDDVSGITPAKTQVMAMGIQLGVVKRMSPDLVQNKVRTIIKMDRSTEDYLVEDTKFWIVKPEVSVSRITGLETIFSGSYIAAQRGKSSKPARTFMGLSSAPPLPVDTPGLHIKLKSTALRSIQAGSNIFFRNITIGSVKTFTLDTDETILIECFIQPNYSHLIRTGSRFFDASGFTLSGKIPDVKFRMESLSSLFTGGIVVETPATLQDSPTAENGDIFTLYEDFEAADYGLPMTLTLASGAGIGEGTTKLMYRGLEAGYVKQLTINNDARRTVTAHILLDPQAEIILREGTQFWLVKPEFSVNGINNLTTLLTGPYITFQPGDGPFKNRFELLPEAPAEPPLRPGRTVFLISPFNPSAGPNAPVYYHGKKVGEVIGSELSEDRNSVETAIFIYDDYADLISSDTVFIESGGLAVTAGPEGFSFQVPPLRTALQGGIDLILPPARGRLLAGGTERLTFPLFADYERALAAVPGLRPAGLYLHLSGDELDSYHVGTPILFKKIRVGQVIGTHYSPSDRQGRVDCFIENEYRELVTTSSRFYRTSGIRLQGDLSGISIETPSLQAMLAGGIGFNTPPGGEPVGDNHQFALYASSEAADHADNVDITVRFASAERLRSGAGVEYRGIRLGSVSRLAFDSDLQNIVATLSIEPSYETFFREQTKIWLTSPSIGLNRIEHLDNILFGATVVLQPGSGTIRHAFVGLDQPPRPLFGNQPGLSIMLEARHLNSLSIGSPIYYRRVKIGAITGYDLTADFKKVLIQAVIDERYRAIVRRHTRFWNVSGISVTGGVFSGFTVSSQSLESLLTGGIELATPDGPEMGAPAPPGYHFILHDKPEDAWLDWSPNIFALPAN